MVVVRICNEEMSISHGDWISKNSCHRSREVVLNLPCRLPCYAMPCYAMLCHGSLWPRLRVFWRRLDEDSGQASIEEFGCGPSDKSKIVEV